MPGLSKGRNAGLTGLFDFPGQSGAKFALTIYGWKQSMGVSERPRVGRGTGRWAKARRILSSGQIVCSGEVRADGWPMPTTFEGVEGNLTITLTAGKTMTVPVRVTAASVELKDVERQLWTVGLTCSITANPTFTGWTGDQPTYTLPTLTDQELYEGLTKQLDPNDLQSTATQRFDIWGLGDTDAAEGAKLASLIAAATAPLTGLKVRSASLDPGRDADAGTITIVWGRTTTAEDVVNSIAAETVDPAGLTSQATVAAINGTPDAPTGDANFVKTASTTRTLNDGNTVTADSYATRTSAQGIEYDGSVTADDPQDLTDSATVAQVTTSSTAPATPTSPITGLKLRSTHSQRLNAGYWRHTFTFARRTTEDDAEYDGTVTAEDPQELTSQARITVVTTSATPPATPAAPASNIKLRTTTTRQLTAGKWSHTFDYATRNSVDDEELGGTVTLTSSDSLGDEASIVIINNESTDAPAAPTANCKLVASLVQPLDDTWTRYTFRYATNTAAERIAFDGTTTSNDPDDLADEATVTQVTTSGTPPAVPSSPLAGAVHRRTITKQLSDGKWRHTFEYGPTTTEDAEEFAGTVADADPNALADESTIRVINDSSTAPSIPSAPTNTKHIGTTSRQLTSAGKWSHTFRYAAQDSKDRVEMGGSSIVDDASDLADETAITLVQGSATPSAPSTPSGLSLVSTTTKQLNDAKWAHTWTYRLLTPAEDIEHRGTTTTADPSQGTTTVTATVETVLSTDTAATLAETARAANAATASFNRVSVRKLTKLKALKIIETAGDDKTVRGSIRTRKEMVKGVPASGGWSASAVDATVRVARVPVVGFNNTVALIQYREVFRARGTLSVRRRIIVTDEASITTAFHLSDRGKLNNATLLGLPANTLMYSGCDLVEDAKLRDGSHLLLLDYHLEHDSMYFQNETRLAIGWVPTATGMTYITGTGDVTATTYFAADMQITFPAETDLSWIWA